jgi:hypothetical protein
VRASVWWMLQRWGISIIYLRLARIDVFKYIIYMWNHLLHFNLVSNFIQPLIFQHNNFFYGFFCLIRSDGFWGFNSFVVLIGWCMACKISKEKKFISWCSDCFQKKKLLGVCVLFLQFFKRKCNWLVPRTRRAR